MWTPKIGAISRNDLCDFLDSWITDFGNTVQVQVHKIIVPRMMYAGRAQIADHQAREDNKIYFSLLLLIYLLQKEKEHFTIFSYDFRIHLFNKTRK
jgi:hypothetical protein